MIEVTQTAIQEIKNFFADKDVMPIRVFVASGGWAGPSVALALDEQKDTDEVFEVDGFKFIAEKEFLKQASPVKIDFMSTGFKVDSNIDLGPSGCSSCGTDEGCAV